MANNNTSRLYKQDIVDLLEEARALIPFYEKENRIHPETEYRYGTVDEVALDLLERRRGVFVTGIKLNSGNITIHAQAGRVSSGKLVWSESTTFTYVLEAFTGTTVARFTYSLCDILTRRATNGDNYLKGKMMGNVSAYSARVRQEVGPHTHLH